MQLINVDEKHDASRTVTSWGWVRLGLSLCLLGLPVLLGCFGFQFADLRNPAVQKDESTQAWVQGLRDQKADLERISQQTLVQLKALTVGLASWHTGLVRPNLLGAALANTAGNDNADVSFAGMRAGIAGPDDGLHSHSHRRNYSAADNRFSSFPLFPSFPDETPHALAGTATPHALALAASPRSAGYPLHGRLSRHKHGRLIDSATYLHATIR